MKPRKLTAREKRIRSKYTCLFSWPIAHSVRLKIGVQTFSVNGWFEDKQEAEWTRDMLAIALAKIEL